MISAVHKCNKFCLERPLQSFPGAAVQESCVPVCWAPYVSYIPRDKSIAQHSHDALLVLFKCVSPGASWEM